MTIDETTMSPAQKPSPAEKRRRTEEAERRERQRRHDIFARVRARMLEGTPLHEIAGRDGLPQLETLLDWLDADLALRARYERARRLQFEIAADALVKSVDSRAGKGATAQRVRIAARRWRDEALARRIDLEEKLDEL